MKPIDNPPALERMRTHIRGVRVPVGGVGLSPPPTAGGGVAPVGVAFGGILGSGHVRNNQLPPLEAGAIPLTGIYDSYLCIDASLCSLRNHNKTELKHNCIADILFIIVW